MSISFKQIEAFVWVADLGSFRGAAERLSTTQPNISTRVSNLEDTLEIKLFVRDGGAVALTSKGKQLLVAARDVLRSMEAFVDASDQSHLVENTIRLGVTEMIVSTWLPIFLKAVKKQYKNLRIELLVDLSVNLKPELFSRSIDMAFQNGPFTRTTSGSEDLGCFPYIWAASPELEISSLGKISKVDMLSEPILVQSRETAQYKEVESHFAGQRQLPPRIIPSSSIAPCIHMAEQGMGITLIPAAMATAYLKKKSLVQIHYDWVPAPLDFLARYDLATAPHIVSELAAMAKEIVAHYPKNL